LAPEDALPAVPLHLRRGGVSLVISLADPMPAVLHWGRDLGALTDEDLLAFEAASVPPVPHSAPDTPVRMGLVPLPSAAWTGTPGLVGRAVGGAVGTTAAPMPVLTAVEVEDRAGEAASVTLDLADAAAGLSIRCLLELTPEGLLRLRQTVTRDAAAASDYELQSLLVLLPLPPSATERLDFGGRWIRERSPQRGPVHEGAWRRDSRHGRPGHDSPNLLIAGTSGFGFRHGEVRGVHVAWSGDQTYLLESHSTGATLLGGGELVGAGEIVLGPGESYESPWVLASWSDAGLDGLAERFHEWVRARPQHPRTPRPLTLNTWEAVYFDQDVEKLRALADAAAAIGVERFVLDDGWFGGRRDDRRGLGDWVVSPDVWPHGLGPLIDHVTGLGMQFGLWVEPEMVNVDSDLYRAHPDWVLGADGRLPVPWRHQQVLDLTNPEVVAFLLERLDAILTENDIAFLKWDHNRDALEPLAAGRPAMHAQTLAVYALLDELRRRHPRVEIETCASGGARADLGILERTDRVWMSDCNDPLERQAIHRWAGLLLPPELIGAHVGAERSHTTGRSHTLAFRAATALFAHAGIEADVTLLDEPDRALLTAWAGVYRQSRDLLHTGRVVNADLPAAVSLRGVVSRDRTEALFSYAVLATRPAAVPGPVALPGLDPQRRYRVRQEMHAGTPWLGHISGPAWLGGATVPGSVLTGPGIAFPVLMPEHALLIRVDAVD
jgi:alpha-galactosidase